MTEKVFVARAGHMVSTGIPLPPPDQPSLWWPLIAFIIDLLVVLAILMIPVRLAMGEDTIGHFRPDPRDENGVAEHEAVMARLVTNNQKEVIRMAEELRLPVVLWVSDCWPETTDDNADFFRELGEARHIAVAEAEAGRGKGSRVVFRHKDGVIRWIPEGKLSRASAKKVREAWMPEGAPDSTPANPWGDNTDRTTVLTPDERQKVLSRKLGTKTLAEYVIDGGRVTQPLCEALGLNNAEAAYATSLGRPIAPQRATWTPPQAVYGGKVHGAPAWSPQGPYSPSTHYQPQPVPAPVMMPRPAPMTMQMPRSAPVFRPGGG